MTESNASTPPRARIGFVGAGDHASRRMYPSLKQVAEAELIAVCDLDLSKAERAAKAYGCTAYDNLDAMIDSENLDAAIVCGSPQMHEQVARQCLQRGLHVYTEKPSAIDAARCQALAELAAEQKRHGLCGFMKRHSPIYQAAKSLVDAGAFGNVSVAEVRWSQGPYGAGWGIDDPVQTCLIGQIIHLFDTIRFLCGEATQVKADIVRVTPERFALTTVFKLANGGLLTLNFNSLESDGWLFHERFRVTGEGAFVEVEDQLRLTYHHYEGWLPESVRDNVILKNQLQVYEVPQIIQHNSLEVGGYVGELRDLALCVLNPEHRPAATFADCAAAMRMAEAVWASLQSGDAAPIAGSDAVNA